MNFLKVTGLSLLALSTQATWSSILTEEKILEFYRGSSLGKIQTLGNYASTNYSASSSDETYDFNLVSEYTFKKSKEPPLSSYSPVYSPYETWSLGVEKQIPIGLSATAEIFGTQLSTNNDSIVDATQTGFKFEGSFDLWKNFLGKKDRATLAKNEILRNQAELEKEISMKREENEVRKLFWSFVSASESIQLSEELIQTAEKQLGDAKNRLREGVSDRGEVAKIQSQVESRKSSSLLFQYERELITQKLENMLQNFRAREWSYGKEVGIEKQNQIKACLDELEKNNQFQKDYTLVDEYIETLHGESRAENVIASSHGGPDLALVTTFQTSGVSNSYSDAQTSMDLSEKNSYQVALTLTLPLNSTSSDSERFLIESKKYLLDAKILKETKNLESTHSTILKALSLLHRGLESQMENTKNLDINSKEMLKKYRQGRISISNLILEQDIFFQSKLQEISLKKQIAHVLLDYFSTFQTFPCKWNQI